MIEPHLWDHMGGFSTKRGWELKFRTHCEDREPENRRTACTAQLGSETKVEKKPCDFTRVRQVNFEVKQRRTQQFAINRYPQKESSNMVCWTFSLTVCYDFPSYNIINLHLDEFPTNTSILDGNLFSISGDSDSVTMPSPGATFGPPPRRESQSFWEDGFFGRPKMGYGRSSDGKIGCQTAQLNFHTHTHTFRNQTKFGDAKHIYIYIQYTHTIIYH